MPESPPPDLICHDGEDQSNKVRGKVQREEPVAIRTFTPSLAVLSHSAGSYHWTLEGRIDAEAAELGEPLFRLRRIGT